MVKDASGQIAVAIGRIRDSAASKLLQLYMRDSDEYVRRRAQLAAAEAAN